MFLEAALSDSHLHGGLDAARQEGMGGDELVWPESGGKEPGRMVMGEPVGAEQGEQGRREWDVAVLATFAVLDMDDHASTVDLGNAQVDAFAEAQASSIDGGETGTVARQAQRGEQTVDLLNAEDGREGTALGRADQFKGGPGALQGMDKEELDGGESDGDGGGGRRVCH